jgi:hypothetical protein
VSPIIGLDDVERRKLLTVSRLELRPLSPKSNSGQADSNIVHENDVIKIYFTKKIQGVEENIWTEER